MKNKQFKINDSSKLFLKFLENEDELTFCILDAFHREFAVTFGLIANSL
jgi:hypothetical protein